MPHCKIITIAQQKGGAGKTTLVTNLATTLSKMRNRVAIIDIDAQGSSTEWHNLRASNFGEDYTGINFISTSGWRLSSEIMKLKSNSDYIIIDSPPHTESDTKSAIRAANLVLIPIQPSPADLWATKATIDLCEKEKISYAVVLNRVTAGSKLATEITAKLSNLLKPQLGNRVVFASCMLEGKSVIETQPKGPAAEEIKALAKEILKLLKNNGLDKAA